jgi:Glycosyltransferase
MAKDRPTVLFLTPGASSVGGNIFLLNFLRWFKRNSDIPFVTVYGHGGDLEDAFAELSPAYNLGYEWDGLGMVEKNIQRVEKYLNIRERAVRKRVAAHNIGLIYSNAVINHAAVAALAEPRPDIPLIAHCHELESLIHKHGIDNFVRLKQRASLFVAAANAVRDNLHDNHGIDSGKIEVIHEFIPIAERSDKELADCRYRIRSSLGIPENAFVVGGSGTLYWRKGPDLSIQIAERLSRVNGESDVYFLWIGGARAGDDALYQARYDIEKIGLSKRVHFIEHLSDPSEHYAAIDVFALTSREDPFPLVCLESAAIGKPVVCFADAGGMPEFVRDDCGRIVPYLDVDAFANVLFELSRNPELVKTFGANAAERVRKDHDIEIAAPRMRDLITRFLLQ